MTTDSEEPFKIPSFLGKRSPSVAENILTRKTSGTDDELADTKSTLVDGVFGAVRTIKSRLTPLFVPMTLLIVLTMFCTVVYPFSGKYWIYFKEHFGLFSSQPLPVSESLQGVLRSTQIADDDENNHLSTRDISAHDAERPVAETQPQIPVAVTAPSAACANVPARSNNQPYADVNTESAPGMITQSRARVDPIDRRASEAEFGMARPFANREADRQLKLGIDATVAKANSTGSVGSRQLRLITVDDGGRDTLHPAVSPVEPPKLVVPPKLFPLSDHLKPIPAAKNALPEAADPHVRVELANSAARVQPIRAGYINAIQVYRWSEGALYQIYAAPSEITDIVLEPGERLVSTGPVAAGDTERWIIDNTESGSGSTNRVHLLIKPRWPELVTNLVIDTDRRTYHLELRSDTKTYMAAVSWIYAPEEAAPLPR